MGVMFLAATALAMRTVSPDWRGLWQEIGARAGSLVARKPPAKKAEPVALAKVETPPTPKPSAKQAEADAGAKQAEKDQAAWDAIKQDAEKAEADRAEAEKIKEKAAEDLANTPPPPPIPRNGGRMVADPALFAELRRRQMQAMQEMMEDQQRMFEQLAQMQGGRERQMLEEFARARPPGFGNAPQGRRNPPQGLGDMPRTFGDPFQAFNQFFAPLPGMDRMNGPLPGMDRLNVPGRGHPQMQEDSGEDVRNGVRRVWRRRVIQFGGR